MEPMGIDPGSEVSEDIVAQREIIASSIVSLSFDGLLGTPLRLQTNQKQCGGQLWPAGMALADFLIRERLDELKGRNMFVRPGFDCTSIRSTKRYVSSIELGAGSGLAG